MNAVTTGNAVHYVCHAGHSYSPETFIAASQEGIEAALWTALSAMQEKVMVLRALGDQAARAGDEPAHRRHHDAAAEVGRAADLLREHLFSGDLGVPSDRTADPEAPPPPARAPRS
jgi:two-component system chemotaxis response regulator CheB